jgi:streptomycin 6-kinase
MQLPDSFINTFRDVYKEDGEKFLAVLPALIDEASQRWRLTDVQPVPNLSFHFVAFAQKEPSPFGRGQTEGDVILKMGIPNHEFISEMAALKLFNGHGTCQLLEYDEERGLLLLERLKPGKMLAELEDDDERTHIAVDVMQKIWHPIETLESNSLLFDSRQQTVRLQNKFIRLSDWFDGLKKIRPHFNGGTGPFPKELLERVESFLPELFADKNVKLIHGDFHHFNILSSERGWLVIDPKGVIGPAGYEIGPLMINPWNSLSDRTKFKVQAERRVSILSERLGWERETIIKWATAHAVLSAWWNIEDGMEDEYSMECATVFSEMK